MADTLAIVRRLEEAGVDRHMAEAHADVIQAAVDDRHENLATKADLARVEASLTWRMIGLQVGVGGLIIAVLKLIP